HRKSCRCALDDAAGVVGGVVVDDDDLPGVGGAQSGQARQRIGELARSVVRGDEHGELHELAPTATVVLSRWYGVKSSSSYATLTARAVAVPGSKNIIRRIAARSAAYW